jgi:hypothetical protein
MTMQSDDRNQTMTVLQEQTTTDRPEVLGLQASDLAGPPPSGPQPPHHAGSSPFVEAKKPRWRYMFAGLGLLVIVAIGAVAAPYLSDGTGDHSVHPSSFAEVEDEYQFGIGTLDIDLRDVEFPPGVHIIDIDHGIGAIRVWLPANINYQVRGDVDAGDLDVFGETDDGFGNEVDARADVNSTATVIIDLEVGIGYGQVRQG